MTTTDVARPSRVAIIGASGTYGAGILARAQEIGVACVASSAWDRLAPHISSGPRRPA